MNNFIALIFLSFFCSCSKNHYTNITEIPEITISTKEGIPSENYTFVNTVNNQKVSVLHSLDKTGFHFYNDVEFKNEDIGVLAGGTGLRTRITQDGGMSWTEFRFSEFANAFHAAAFSGNALFVVGESQYIFRSMNLGKNWSVFDTNNLFGEENAFPQYKFYKIRFIDQSDGFIAGERNGTPVFLKTNDGGKHWEFMNINGISQIDGAITDFTVHSGKEITIVTSFGACYRTQNGGANWKLLYKTKPLNSVAFMDKETGYIGGIDGTLLHTDNGGKSWDKIDVPEKPNITDIILSQNIALITTSISFSDNRDLFVYRIDQKERKFSHF